MASWAPMVVPVLGRLAPDGAAGYPVGVGARARSVGALLGAVAAHAALAAWIAWGPATRSHDPDREAQLREARVDSDALEVSVEPSPESAPVEPLAGAEVPPPQAVARAETPRVAGRELPPQVPQGGAEPGAPISPSAPPSPSAEASGEGSWSFSPTGQPGSAGAVGGPGLSGDGLASAVSAGVRATVAEDRARHDPTKHLLPTFTDRDIALGLVPGGAWVTLTRDHVQGSDLPMAASALLEFTTDAHGIVAKVRVVDASSDRHAWDVVAAELEQRAKSIPTRVPTGADGVAVTLQVTSKRSKDMGPETLGKILEKVTDPIDAIVDSQTPERRIVAVRIVSATAF